MARYQAKPIVVDAEQWLGKSGPDHLSVLTSGDGPAGLIDTRRGWQDIYPNDWIVTCEISGERFVCEPDVFPLMYEPVDDEMRDGTVAQ